MKTLTFFATTLLSLVSFNSYAATVDGNITGSEYLWNTNGAEGSEKWISQGNYSNDPDLDDYARGENGEHDDASTGDRWDINYLGTSVENDQFQFGLIGGDILSGRETGRNIFLSDIAISATGFGIASTDPTTDSSDFQYAIRLLDVNDTTGVANFALLEGGTWEGANMYAGTRHEEKHKTSTYQMIGATKETLFSGIWNSNGGDDNVLEGGFDLSLLSIFDPSVGGRLSTYITMACVNDEAMVHADVTAVPVPAALWLFTPALIGLVGLRRRMKA